ncbi:MCE family protein [Streptomyces sp. N2-109]|uniref:MCE family protein n=1 Tax=Streptomyces gossypii TaxID=2883101 RepID=A0ABT2JYS1_9ACTN|nr:MlaD family protein [Streptomyces gossypii]MCT2592404.1 MCE family protein [Streptomyces gossypii]
MVTLSTHIRNLTFLVLGAVVLAYIAVQYADLGRYIGMRGYYTVRVELPRTGGLFGNANVTYRGVDIGRVGSVELTDGGVEAEIRIDDSAPPIPADLSAEVASLSAVGEQYLDLAPRTDEGPYLEDGSVVQQQDTATPAPVTDVLTSVNDLAASVPLDSLRVAVDEMGKAFHGQGQNLQVLLDTGSEFIAAADEALPATTLLLTDGETVLRTQNEEAEAIRSFASGAAELAAQLKDSDSDLRRLITQAPQAADQVTALVRENDPAFSVLLANLTTTSELLVTRQRGTEELMVRLPQVIAAGSTATTPDGIRFGMVTTFFEPLPCTSGYGGTTYRNGLDTSPPPSVNTDARCDASPASGQNVRGSRNAPSGGVPEPARAGSLDTGNAGVDDGPRDLSGLLGVED